MKKKVKNKVIEGEYEAQFCDICKEEIVNPTHLDKFIQDVFEFAGDFHCKCVVKVLDDMTKNTKPYAEPPKHDHNKDVIKKPKKKAKAKPKSKK